MEQYDRLVRSRRRTMSIEVTSDAKVIVRVPISAPDAAVQAFVASHKDWIAKQRCAQQARLLSHPEPDESARLALIARAKEVLPQRVSHYAAIMGLQPTSLRITGAKTRFGSCSAKNGLCFSFRLMQYEDRAIDYVVVHELAHIRHKNHGPDFYRTIEAVLPDYRQRIRLLKNG